MSLHNMNILGMVQMTKSLIEISVTSHAQGNVLSTMSKLETFIYVDNCAPYFLIDERYRRDDRVYEASRKYNLLEAHNAAQLGQRLKQ